MSHDDCISLQNKYNNNDDSGSMYVSKYKNVSCNKEYVVSQSFSGNYDRINDMSNFFVWHDSSLYISTENPV